MLKALQVQNFTAFKDCNLTFSQGLNVLCGENAAGKSHLLKLGYALLSVVSDLTTKTSRAQAERAIAQKLAAAFNSGSPGRLVTRKQGVPSARVRASWGEQGALAFSFSARSTEKVRLEELHLEKHTPSALFIPSKEILSIFPGFSATLERRELSFDDTYLHLAKSLHLPPLKQPLAVDVSRLLSDIEESIQASVVKKDNRFYFRFRDTRGELEASLVAEGYCKVGMLAHLLANGELGKGSSLFWDTPEATLNPSTLRKLVHTLVALSRLMQITIATHSIFLLRELEILQERQLVCSAKE